MGVGPYGAVERSGKGEAAIHSTASNSSTPKIGAMNQQSVSDSASLFVYILQTPARLAKHCGMRYSIDNLTTGFHRFDGVKSIQFVGLQLRPDTALKVTILSLRKVPAIMPRSKKTTESKAPAKASEVGPQPTEEKRADSQPSEERQSQFATILIGLLIIASGLLVYNYFQSVNSPSTTTSTEQAQNNKPSGSTTPNPTSKPSPSPTVAPSPKPTAPSNTNKSTNQPSAPANSQYTVQAGDSLWSVAEKTYGDGHQWDKLAQANNLPNDAQGRPLLEVGQVITLPGQTAVGSTGSNPVPSQVAGASTGLTQTPSTAVQTYTVKHGDTLWGIAQAIYGQGADWRVIFDDPHNRLGLTPDGQPLIHAGNELYLPQAP